MTRQASTWEKLSYLFGKGRPVRAPRSQRKTQPVLEMLESREVPATWLVSTLLDSTNAATPLPGSLREAVNRLAQPGDTIQFADSLFSAGSQQTLTLNGAVGYLNVVQNDITIAGPGKFTSGTNAGQYKILLQSDTGFTGVNTNSISNAGLGYKIGDVIRQGATEFEGGAEFVIQGVNASGGVTQLAVSVPGANSNFTGTLSGTGTGINFLATSVGSGSGLQLTNLATGLSSSIIWSQQVPASNQLLSLSGIHFGNARVVTIQQNLGDLAVSDCMFNRTASTFINTAGGGRSLTISDCAFTGANTQVNMGGSGPLDVNSSTFTNASNGAAISGGGAALTITNSAFTNANSRVTTSGPTALVSNTYFQGISGGAITFNGTSATLTDTFFANNSKTANNAIRINPSSYSAPTNAQNGGAAIFAYNNASLKVSRSLFLNNRVTGINNLNSGGGAIYNYSGSMALDQCGFESNAITITGYPRKDPPDDATVPADNPEKMPSPANSGGGAVYGGGSTTITNSYFTKNQVDSSVDFWVYTKLPTDGSAPPNSQPQYGGGGALFLTSNAGQSAQINLANSTIVDNHVTFISGGTNTWTGKAAVGTGLNGGGILIAAGVDSAANNVVQSRAINGTTSAQIVNCTIVNNSLDNPNLIGTTAMDSNLQTIQATGNQAWGTASATGGIFNNTGNGSSITMLNSIAMNNTGISYVNLFGQIDGTARLQESNIATRYSADGAGSIQSNGFNMYKSTFGFGTGARGDLQTQFSPGFNGGLQNNLGPVIGLAKPVAGLAGQGRGNVLTIALDRLSAGRDAGSNSVYPNPLSTDGRGINRLINLAVDMGAFEVQTGTSTGVGSPALNPISTPYTNPWTTGTYGLTLPLTAQILPNDNKAPSQKISGTVTLVSAADPNVVYAIGTVQPVDPANVSKGGNSVLQLNDSTKNPTVIPTYNFNNTFTLATSGIQSGIFQPNLKISAGQSIRLNALDSLGKPVPNTYQDAIVISYNLTTGLLQFSKTAISGSGTYSTWSVQLLDANKFTLGISGSQTIYLGTGLANLVAGQSITLTATDSTGLPVNNANNWQHGVITAYDSVSGSLTFTKDGRNGTGAFNYWFVKVDPLSQGANNYMLVYSGDTDYAISQSNVFTIDVNAASTTTTLQSSMPAGLAPGGAVDFTGTVLAAPSNQIPSSTNTVELKYRAYGTTVWNSFATPKTANVNGDGTFAFPNVTFPASPITDYELQAVYNSNNTGKFTSSTSSTYRQEFGNSLNGFTFSLTPGTVERGGLITLSATATYSQGAPAGPSVVSFQTIDGKHSFPATIQTPASAPSAGTVVYSTAAFDPAVLALGTSTLRAVYQHTNGSYLTVNSSNTADLVITPITTITNLGINPNPSIYSFNPELTATITPVSGVTYNNPAGTVDFQLADGTSLGTAPVNLDASGYPTPVKLKPATTLSAGTYSILAVYSGDNLNYKGSTSTPQALVVNKASTSLTLNPGTSPVEAGTPITFTATLANSAAASAIQPTGTVELYLGSALVTRANLVGNKATFSGSKLVAPNTAGQYIYTAKYVGSANYASSTNQAVLDVYVKQATTTTLKSSTKSSIYGSQITFTVTVAPNGPPAFAGGTIQLQANGILIGSQPAVVNAQGNLNPAVFNTNNLPAGNIYVTANYTGDNGRYLPSSSNSVSITISKASTTLDVTPSSGQFESGKPIVFTAKVASPQTGAPTPPTGLVNVSLNGVNVGSAPIVAGTATYIATPTLIGNTQYTFSYGGDANYSGASASANIRLYKNIVENYYMVAPQQGPFVQIFDRVTNQQKTVFQPFGPYYSGGFTVGRGDVNNDGFSDMLFAPRSGGPIQIFDGNDFRPLGAVYPFGAGFSMPLSFAVGDLNSDGFGDIIAAPGGFGMPPHVVAISGHNLSTTLFSQYVYSSSFRGGVSVAAGDVNGDGPQDIIAAPLAGAPPHIVSFNGRTGALLQSYYAYSPSYMGGVSITAADLDNDGFTEVITGASATAPHVVILDARTQSVKASFYAYAANFGGGVRVTTVRDLNGDGINDIIVGPGPGAGPNVIRFDGKKALQNQAVVLDSFFAYGQGTPYLNYLGGTFVG